MADEKVITIWDRWNDKHSKWVFNHISDGYNDELMPKPKGELQEKSWPSGKWQKHKGNLVNSIVEFDDET